MSADEEIVAFTLCEPPFLVGAAALFNSLIAAGFRGTFIVGIKGEAQGWLRPLPQGLPAGVHVRVVATPGDRHLTHGKALFARRILDELEPSCSGVAYFDPDVVVKAPWAEIVQRMQAACSVCADCCVCPDIDKLPWEENVEAWSQFGRAVTGLTTRMEGLCCNGGFIGVMRTHRVVLDCWENLLLECIKRGFDPTSFAWNGPRALPFFFVDQDMLNLAIRLAGVPVWIGGPETMDFAPGGNFLSHAISMPKPWNRWYLPRAVSGRHVRFCDLAFWQHVTTPIPAVPAVARWCHQADLALARLIAPTKS